MGAGLCPDPLGKLKRSPVPLAATWSLLLRQAGRDGKEKGNSPPNRLLSYATVRLAAAANGAGEILVVSWSFCF